MNHGTEYEPESEELRRQAARNGGSNNASLRLVSAKQPRSMLFSSPRIRHSGPLIYGPILSPLVLRCV